MNAIILEQRATMDNLLTKVTVSSVMILQIHTVIGLCISWILLIKMMMKTAVLFIAVLVGCF